MDHEDKKGKEGGADLGSLLEEAVIDASNEKDRPPKEWHDLDAGPTVIGSVSQPDNVVGFDEFANVEVYDKKEATEPKTSVSTKEMLDEEVEVEQLSEAGVEGTVQDAAVSISGLEIIDWRAVIARLAEDAAEHSNHVISARLYAEAGRIAERRLADTAAAASWYDKALAKDPLCLAAIQGKRRVQVQQSQWDEVVELLESERLLASDPVVHQKIDHLATAIDLWNKGGLSAETSKAFEALRSRDPLDPVPRLMVMLSAFGQGDASQAARELKALAALSHDKLLGSRLKSLSGLLHEIAGEEDAAAVMFQEAVAEGEAEADRTACMALWRMRIKKGQWAEAQEEAMASLGESDSELARGHRFLLAAQTLFVLGKPEEAAAIMRPLPPSMSTLFLQFFAALGSGTEGPEAWELIKRFEQKLSGPPSLKAALQWLLAESCPDIEEAAHWYQRCIESDRSLLLPQIELAELAAGPGGAQLTSYLASTLEECLRAEERKWVAGHLAILLLESGREREGEEAVKRYLSAFRDEDFVWLLGLYYLARNQVERWADLMGRWSTLISDPDALLGVRLLQGDMNEFVLGKVEEAHSIRKSILTDRVPATLPFHSLAFHPEHSRDKIIFNKEAIMDQLEGEGGAELIPAIMNLLSVGAVSAVDEREAIYRRILKLRPGHLPAFCALRRELLSQKRFEDYFEVLGTFLNVSQELERGILGRERIVLLGLSRQPLIVEEELKRYFLRWGDEKFLPIYFSTLDTSPRLAAESREAMAAMLPAAAAQRWWFDAARKWTGVDPARVASCIARLSDPEWRRVGEGLVEADAWLREDWGGLADALLEQIRRSPEGEAQPQQLTRMAYVDLLLKGDPQVGFPVVKSLVGVGGAVPLVELRMLFKHLLAQGEVDGLFPVLRAMAAQTKWSEEAAIWTWLAFRVARSGSDQAAIELLWSESLVEVEKFEEDIALLLLTEMLALARGKIEVFSRVIEQLMLLTAGEREQGCLVWLLSMMLSETDPESALWFAKAATERMPLNPGAAYVAARIAEIREDWSAAAANAKLAGGLFREADHAVEEILRAAEIYKEKVGEIGWALQCYEQVLSKDPKNERAFEGLRSYYAETAAWERLAGLIETKLAHVEDGQQKLKLRRMLADAYDNAGKTREAAEVMAAIVDLTPDDTEALRQLAELSMKDSQWEGAVSALQQLLNLTLQNEERVEIFMRLGDIYLNHLPDPARAIYCYERVNEYGPLNLEVAEKLASLYAKTMDWEKGLEQVQLLFDTSEQPDQKMKWLIVAGELFEEGAKDLRRAEKVYETARGLLPTAPEPIVHLIRLYKKKNDTTALSFLLQRSIGDIKVFQQQSPDDISLYHTVMRILAEGGDLMGTRIAGTLLSAFREILPDEVLTLQRCGGPFTWNGGPWVAVQELEEHLAPPSLTHSFRVLIERLYDTVLRSIPTDLERYGVTRGSKLQKRWPQDEALLEEVARWYAVKKPQVSVVGTPPEQIAVLADSPPILVVGENLYSQMSRAHKIYLFAWICKQIHSKLLPLLAVPEHELPALWVAIIQQFEPSFFLAGVSAEATSKFLPGLHRNFPKRLKEDLYGLALECSSDPSIDVQGLYGGLATYADRAALLACGSIQEAIDLHWMMQGEDKELIQSGLQIKSLMSRSRRAARLCEFIISGALAKCLAFRESG